MQSKIQINSYQLVIIIIASALGVSLLELPSYIGEILGSESWIATLAGGIFATLSVFLMCLAGKNFESDGLVQSSKKLFGKTIGVILIIPIVISVFIANVVELKLFTITVKVFLLDKTPVQYILMPFLLLVMFLGRGEFKHVIRFLSLVFPFIIAIILGLSLLTLPGTDFSNLLPVFQKSPLEYLDGASRTMFAVLGILTIIIMLPYTKKRDFKTNFKTCFLTILFLTILYTVITILCLAKLGSSETKWILYPTVSLIKSAYIPGGFIERLEGALMSIWVVIAFSTVMITLYGLSILLSDILNLVNRKLVITIIIPLLHLSCFAASSTFKMLSVSSLNSIILGGYILYILPIIFIIGYKVKKKRGGCCE